MKIFKIAQQGQNDPESAGVIGEATSLLESAGGQMHRAIESLKQIVQEAPDQNFKAQMTAVIAQLDAIYKEYYATVAKLDQAGKAVLSTPFNPQTMNPQQQAAYKQFQDAIASGIPPAQIQTMLQNLNVGG
jgi:ABC-type transporter Mla subunit MlaD